MGQYFKPIILNEQNDVTAWAYSHDYGNGLKLMEHSYVGNDFVSKFESLLIPGSELHKSKVVWGGDYADEEEESEEHDSETLYNKCLERNKANKLSFVDPNEFPFVLNHDKKQYVDKRTMKKFGDDKSWQIHPLPLLTCEGNGRGGGDYYPRVKKNDGDLIGTWARNVISIEKTLDGYEDYTELKPKFVENW